MPCNDGGIPYPPTKEEIAREQFNKRAPSMLCSACRALDLLGYDFDLNPELSEWWDKHKKEDDRKEQARRKAEWQKRVAEEASQKSIKDLTPEEKSLLAKLGYFK